VLVVVEEVENAKGHGVELRRRLPHGASKHAHGEGHGGPSLGRTVHEGAHDALVLLERLRRRRLGLMPCASHACAG
jgi:hypothetical protein